MSSKVELVAWLGDVVDQRRLFGADDRKFKTVTQKSWICQSKRPECEPQVIIKSTRFLSEMTDARMREWEWIPKNNVDFVD